MKLLLKLYSVRLVYSIVLVWRFVYEVNAQPVPLQNHQENTSDALNRKAVEQSTVNPDVAMRFARQAEAVAKRSGNVLECARACNTIGVIFRYKDLYDSAQSYHSKALGLFEQLGSASGKAETLLNLGGVHQSRADYTAALEYHLQALTLYESLNDSSGTARALASIGIVYTAKGAFDQARAYHRRSLQLRTAIGDGRAIAHAWRNLGSVYLAEHVADTALAMYKGALSVFERVGDKQGISLSYASIGAALQQAGKNAEALHYQFKAIPLLEQLGDRRGLAVLFNTISATLIALNNHAQALTFATRALSIADSIGAGAEQRDAHKTRSDALAGLGNASAALEAYRQYSALKDSLFTLQSAQKIETLQSRYELAEKEKKLLSLEQQRNGEAMKVRGLWAVLLAATVLFGAVIMFVNYRYRLKKRAADALAAQNEEILRQRELLKAQSEEIQRANESLRDVNHQLELQNAELQTLNAEKNEFLGIAAHDLKNPLSNILLTVQLIETHSDSSATASVLEWTNAITTSAEYMLNIITNLLDVNKIESGAVEMSIEAVSTNLIELIADAYTFRAMDKNITLALVPPATGVSVLADQNALQQVLENLISNAIKFSPPKTTVTVRVQEQSITVRVEITDQGPGISPEDQQKLFGKFSRLSARPTGGEHSTGLGLSIVKKLVEAMSGRVWCESELGNGATFIVELPKAS